MSSEQSVAHTKRLEESSEGKIYLHFNILDVFDLYLNKKAFSGKIERSNYSFNLANLA